MKGRFVNGSEYLRKIIDRMQSLFNEEEMMIFAIVLACVTLLPVFVCLFRRRAHVRRVSMAVFIVYIIGNLSYTILNREVISQTAVILNPLSDFESAFYLDLGVIGTIKELLRSGPRAAQGTVHIVSSRMAKEVLLNILLYIPMGYLLPFVWKQLRSLLAITTIGLLCSLATELAQLIFRIGCFQVDDIICNTGGTVIGALLGLALIAFWRVR